MLIMKKEETFSVDKKIIDNIRGLAIDVIDNAKSGHPGIALGAAPIIATVYANHLNFDTANDKWINRDRFVMSAGHGSALLYSTLFMAGFPLTLDDLKEFRKLGSLTPGHPEYPLTPGVDISTGPLGQGFASSVGIAIGECYLRGMFGHDIINYHTYVLCGDGDLMEGVSYEAASLAGRLKLNKLIVLYDSNAVTLDGKLSNSFDESIKGRFEAMNWNYLLVSDGEDTASINNAIEKAKSSDKPTIIEIKTVIGKYSEKEGTSKVHGSPLSQNDIVSVKEKLGLRDIPFTVSNEALNTFQSYLKERNNKKIEEWQKAVDNLDDDKRELLDAVINNKRSIKLKDISYEFPDDGFDSTRVASGKIINSIAEKLKLFIGGSADVSNSTYAKITDTLDFTSISKDGRNINFGIREHAMGAVANGIALTGLTPFVSTFLSFADYLKPAIRMSALMDLPVIYVFSHDSITVGEDGPTHQPVEQLIMLRSIPNVDVYRPADSNEVIGVYNTILESRKPSVVVLGRNKVKIQETTSTKEVKNGAYIISEEVHKCDLTLLSSGEEISIALEVQKLLLEKGISARVVSVPSIELFEKKEQEYKDQIINPKKPVFVIEASSPYSWYQYVNKKEHLFTINEFGYSGNKEDVLKKFGFDAPTIAKKIEKLLD